MFKGAEKGETERQRETKRDEERQRQTDSMLTATWAAITTSGCWLFSWAGILGSAARGAESGKYTHIHREREREIKSISQ